MLVVVFRDRLRRRRWDFAGFRAVQHDVVDGALLIVVAVLRVRHGLGRRDLGGDGVGDLAPHGEALLLGGEALLGEARVPNELLKTRAVELAGRRLERRIVHDLPRDLGVRDVEAKLARTLVERGFGDELAHELLVEAQQLGLIRCDRTAELAAELLDAIVVDLAELGDRDLGRADLRDGGLAESAEDVADSPDRKAYGDQAEDDPHDDPPEPIGGGLAHTAEHESPLVHKGISAAGAPFAAKPRIIGMAALGRNLSLLAAITPVW